MPKESLLASMPKLILAVVLIVCVGAVMGLMGWALTKKQTRVEVPEIKAPDGIVEDNTSDWQTYRNEEFGFEIKYPEEWNYNGGPLPYMFYFGESGGIYDHQVGIKVEEDSSLEKFYKDVHQNCKKTFVDSKEGLKCEGRNWVETERGVEANYFVNYIYVEIESNGKFYLFSVFASDKFLDRIKNFNQMLSSFKFIEKDEITDWQTYRNEEFGFEIKYPSEFSLTEEHLNFVHFEKGNRYWMSVKVENRNNKSIDQWIESDRDGRKDFPYTKIRNINIDSIDTVIVLEPITEGEDYYRSFIPVGDKMLIFEYTPGYIEYQSAEFYQVIDEFNQILSTFKFIEK